MHRPTCEEGLVLLFSSDFQHEENQCSPDPVNCNKRMSQMRGISLMSQKILRNAKQCANQTLGHRSIVSFKAIQNQCA